VRAGLVRYAEDYVWSSAKTHVLNVTDKILSKSPLEDEIKNWRAYLTDSEEEKDLTRLRRHTQTGRPLGPDDYLINLEQITGRNLIKQKPGPRREIKVT